MSESIGQELKRIRQSKKLTTKQVAQDTRMSTKYVEALESDNFHFFAGETYSLGFLRTYALYLNIDENKIIQKYKGQRMMQAQTPVKQLTEKSIHFFDYFNNYLKLGSIIAGAVVFVFLIVQYLINQPFDSAKPITTQKNVIFNIQDYLKESGKVPEEKIDSVGFANGIIITIIRRREGISFLLQGNKSYIVLQDLKYQTVGTSNKGDKNQAILTFYPGKQTVTLNQSELHDIDFPWLIEKLRLKLLGMTPNNVKMKIQKLGKNENFDEKYLSDEEGIDFNESGGSEIINPNNFTITMVVKATGENYVEFYIDGKQKKKGLLPAGEILHFEADESIQMKIGDAGAIEVTINGKKPIKKGRRGQQMNKIIRKVRDPLEQGKYSLEIKDT